MQDQTRLHVSQANLTLLAFFGAVLLIGSNLVAIRFSNRELAPFWGAGTRFAIAALLFYVTMVMANARFPRGRDLFGAAAYGAVGIAAYFALVYWGLVKVAAGHGQVLLSLTPLLTLFFAAAHQMEVFRWRAAVAALVATLGVAVLFADQISTDVPILSLFALVLAAACAAEAGIVLKLIPPASLLAASCVAMAVGALVLLSVSLITGEERAVPERIETWIAFAYLATIGTLGTFLLYMYVLKFWMARASSSLPVPESP
jgi:drug/metabolite transporter (DMT)-like permease